MAFSKVLVLGATGPSGVCLLRELLHREYTTVAYVRNPSKIDDLSSHPLLTVIKGNMDNKEAFAEALTGVDLIISLIGPQLGVPLSPFDEYYANVVFPAMREKKVKRIIACSTGSAPAVEDSFSLVLALMKILVRMMAPGVVPLIQRVAKVFHEEDTGLEWIIFRLPWIVGDIDEASWRRDREGQIQAGFYGDSTTGYRLNRSALARWLVDLVESGQDEWVGKMPAVSQHSV